MKTVLVGGFFKADYIDYNTPDLNSFFQKELNS